MGDLIQGFLPDSDYDFSSIPGKTLHVVSIGLMFVAGGVGAIAELVAGVYLLAVLVTGGSVGSWGTALLVLIVGAVAPLVFALAFGVLVVLFALLCYPFERPAILRRRAEEAEAAMEQDVESSETDDSFDPDDIWDPDRSNPLADFEEPTMSRYCGRCGFRFDDQHRFCPGCGTEREMLD